MLAKLDDAVATYLCNLLRRGFAATSASESAGNGCAERTYRLDHVVLRAVYERGLAYLEVGCADRAGPTVEASSLRDLLDPPASGRWNLGMGAADFLDAHWDQVYALTSPSNWPDTVRRVAARQR